MLTGMCELGGATARKGTLTKGCCYGRAVTPAGVFRSAGRDYPDRRGSGLTTGTGMADQPGIGVVVLSPTDVEAIRTKADPANQLRRLRRRHARQCGDSPLTYRELAGRTGWAHGVIGDYFPGK